MRSRLIRVVGLLIVVAAVGAALLAWAVRGPVVLSAPHRPVHLDASAERMREVVTVLSTRFRNRWITHPDVLAETATWIEARIEELGLEVTVHEYTLREGTFRNLEVLVPGSVTPAGALIVGAHYDAYGELPGADDNASGVAVLLELARALAGEKPRHPVRLVWFVNEEPPFFAGEDMGSLRYARALADSGVAVELMISLEMVGCFSDEPGSQSVPSAVLRPLYPRRGNFLAVVGDARSGGPIRRVKRAMRASGAIDVYSFRGPAWVAGVDWSDHRSFWQVGYPAVMVTDTAFLRNPRYHTRYDTADTLDYVRMEGVVRAVHSVVRDVAGLENGKP
jgi:Zn-dependent M28 family amino/carboxypeptidase